MMFLGWLLGLLGLGALAFGLGWRPAQGGHPRSEGSGSATDVLKERYARGEISREEYEEMRRDLEG